MDIQLNFVNRSEDANNSSIVIFQKNTHQDFDEIATAWHIIQVATHGIPYQFAYSVDEHFIGAGASVQIKAEPKTEYNVIDQDGRPVLVVDPNEQVEGNGYVFENLMEYELIDANVYNAGSKIAGIANVAPGQKVTIELEPETLYVGFAKTGTIYTEGGQLSKEFLADTSRHVKIDLSGVKENTTILLQGGGKEPYTYTLEKTVEEIPAAAE